MKNLTKQKTYICFSELENLAILPPKYKDNIINADIVVMPRLHEHRTKDKIFTEGTLEYFKALRQYRTDIKSEICADDNEFKELALHSDEITLPMLLVTSMGFPLAVEFIWHYIQNYVLAKRNNDDVNVNVSIVVDDKGNPSKIDYSGKASDFEEIIDQIMRLKDEDD